MWFFIVVIGMVAAYISGRRWGLQLYDYYRPRLTYILLYVRRKLQSTKQNIPALDTANEIDTKKKFDLETVNYL